MTNFEKDKIIIDYLGYELKPCNSGKAWDCCRKKLPLRNKLQGKLYQEYAWHSPFTDWNGAMSIVEVLSNETSMSIAGVMEKIVDDFGYYYTVEEFYNKLIEFIQTLKKPNW